MKKNGIDVGKRKLNLAGGAALFILYSLNCFLILPVRNMLASDVLFASNLVVINLLSLVGELLEVTAISVFYAVMLWVIYRYGSKSATGTITLFVVATVYKYAANTAVSWIYDGSIPTTWAWDIVDVLFYGALEFLQLLIIFAFVKGVITQYTEKRDLILRVAAKSDSDTTSVLECVYPFDCLYKRSNCLLRSAFICAVVTVISKEVGALVSDVWLIAVYGLPEDAVTWLHMLVSYVSKVLLGFVVYFVTVCAMNLLGVEKRTEK